MKANLMLVGVIKSEEFTGYAVANKTTGAVNQFNREEFNRLVKGGKICNMTMLNNGRFDCTSSSLTSIPVYNENGVLLKNNGITVLQVKKQKDGASAYSLMDTNFRVQVVKEEQAISLIESYKSINAKIVTRNGKKFISAKKGNLDTIEYKSKKNTASDAKVKDNNNNKTQAQDKGKANDEILYLGNSLTVIPSLILFEYKRFKDSLNKVEQGEKLTPYSYYDNLKIEYYLLKIIKCYIAGNIGNKYKSHYENTIRLLKSLKMSEVKCVVPLLETKKGSYAKLVKEVQSGNFDKFNNILPIYFRLKAEMCVDYLKHARTGFMQYNLKDMIGTIYNCKEAMNYIEENSEVSGREALMKAVSKSAKSNVMAVSQIMFISGLALAQEFRLYENSLNDSLSPQVKHSLYKSHRRRIYGIIGYVSRMVNETPVEIRTDKELGAMLFQAMVIATEVKLGDRQYKKIK